MPLDNDSFAFVVESPEDLRSMSSASVSHPGLSHTRRNSGRRAGMTDGRTWLDDEGRTPLQGVGRLMEASVDPRAREKGSIAGASSVPSSSPPPLSGAGGTQRPPLRGSSSTTPSPASPPPRMPAGAVSPTSPPVPPHGSSSSVNSATSSFPSPLARPSPFAALPAKAIPMTLSPPPSGSGATVGGKRLVPLKKVSSTSSRLGEEFHSDTDSIAFAFTEGQTGSSTGSAPGMIVAGGGPPPPLPLSSYSVGGGPSSVVSALPPSRHYPHNSSSSTTVESASGKGGALAAGPPPPSLPPTYSPQKPRRTVRQMSASLMSNRSFQFQLVDSTNEGLLGGAGREEEVGYGEVEDHPPRPAAPPPPPPFPLRAVPGHVACVSPRRRREEGSEEKGGSGSSSPAVRATSLHTSGLFGVGRRASLRSPSLDLNSFGLVCEDDHAGGAGQETSAGTVSFIRPSGAAATVTTPTAGRMNPRDAEWKKGGEAGGGSSRMGRRWSTHQEPASQKGPFGLPWIQHSHSFMELDDQSIQWIEEEEDARGGGAGEEEAHKGRAFHRYSSSMTPISGGRDTVPQDASPAGGEAARRQRRNDEEEERREKGKTLGSPSARRLSERFERRPSLRPSLSRSHSISLVPEDWNGVTFGTPGARREDDEESIAFQFESIVVPHAGDVPPSPSVVPHSAALHRTTSPQLVTSASQYIVPDGNEESISFFPVDTVSEGKATGGGSLPGTVENIRRRSLSGGSAGEKDRSTGAATPGGDVPKTLVSVRLRQGTPLLSPSRQRPHGGGLPSSPVLREEEGTTGGRPGAEGSRGSPSSPSHPSPPRGGDGESAEEAGGGQRHRTPPSPLMGKGDPSMPFSASLRHHRGSRHGSSARVSTRSKEDANDGLRRGGGEDMSSEYRSFSQSGLFFPLHKRVSTKVFRAPPPSPLYSTGSPKAGARPEPHESPPTTSTARSTSASSPMKGPPKHPNKIQKNTKRTTHSGTVLHSRKSSVKGTRPSRPLRKEEEGEGGAWRWGEEKGIEASARKAAYDDAVRTTVAWQEFRMKQQEELRLLHRRLSRERREEEEGEEDENLQEEEEECHTDEFGSPRSPPKESAWRKRRTISPGSSGSTEEMFLPYRGEEKRTATREEEWQSDEPSSAVQRKRRMQMGCPALHPSPPPSTRELEALLATFYGSATERAAGGRGGVRACQPRLGKGWRRWSASATSSTIPQVSGEEDDVPPSPRVLPPPPAPRPLSRHAAPTVSNALVVSSAGVAACPTAHRGGGRSTTAVRQGRPQLSSTSFSSSTHGYPDQQGGPSVSRTVAPSTSLSSAVVSSSSSSQHRSRKGGVSSAPIGGTPALSWNAAAEVARMLGVLWPPTSSAVWKGVLLARETRTPKERHEEHDTPVEPSPITIRQKTTIASFLRGKTSTTNGDRPQEGQGTADTASPTLPPPPLSFSSPAGRGRRNTAPMTGSHFSNRTPRRYSVTLSSTVKSIQSRTSVLGSPLMNVESTAASSPVRNGAASLREMVPHHTEPGGRKESGSNGMEERRGGGGDGHNGEVDRYPDTSTGRSGSSPSPFSPAPSGVSYPKLYFLNGTRLTTEQTQHFLDMVAKQEGVIAAQRALRRGDATQLRDTTSTPPPPPPPPLVVSPLKSGENHIAPPAFTTSTPMPMTPQTAPIKFSTCSRSHVLREVFDVMDAQREGRLRVEWLPTLQQILERDLAIMERELSLGGRVLGLDASLKSGMLPLLGVGVQERSLFRDGETVTDDASSLGGVVPSSVAPSMKSIRANTLLPPPTTTSAIAYAKGWEQVLKHLEGFYKAQREQEEVVKKLEQWMDKSGGVPVSLRPSTVPQEENRDKRKRKKKQQWVTEGQLTATTITSTAAAGGGTRMAQSSSYRSPTLSPSPRREQEDEEEGRRGGRQLSIAVKRMLENSHLYYQYQREREWQCLFPTLQRQFLSLRRRAILVSFAVNVVLPLCVGSHMGELDFGSMASLVLMAASGGGEAREKHGSQKTRASKVPLLMIEEGSQATRDVDRSRSRNAGAGGGGEGWRRKSSSREIEQEDGDIALRLLHTKHSVWEEALQSYFEELCQVPR